MGKVISFEDFEFNKVTKILADAYFDFIGFVYSHELYDSDRYNHTKVIDIKYLKGYDKEVLTGEFLAYFIMYTKYPKSYPFDRNWSIEFLPHFQDPKKIAKLSHKEKVETIKKEKYELLKKIYSKKTFYSAMEEMDINPLKYEPVSYILWEISDYFEEFKKLWKGNKEFRFNIRYSIAIWSFNIAVWSFLIADIVSEIQK